MIILEKRLVKKKQEKNLDINVDDKIILFFGFIRKYKGLDILLEAMKLLKSEIEIRIENSKLLLPVNFMKIENYTMTLLK